jgi:hypothetical protein
LNEQLEQQSNRLAERSKVLANREHILEEKKSRLVSIIESTSNIVKINVGGTIFTTTKETLTAQKYTILAGLLNVERDENGEIFVDRNPKFFDMILDHLRGVDISKTVQNMTKQDRQDLLNEANYYCISSLRELIDKNQRTFWGL